MSRTTDIIAALDIRESILLKCIWPRLLVLAFAFAWQYATLTCKLPQPLYLIFREMKRLYGYTCTGNYRSHLLLRDGKFMIAYEAYEVIVQTDLSPGDVRVDARSIFWVEIKSMSSTAYTYLD